MQKILEQWLLKPIRRSLDDLPWLGPVLSAVLVALTVNVFTETLTNAGGPILGWIVILVMALVTFIVIYAYSLWQGHREQVWGPIIDINQPLPAQGLIFLAFREETLEKAIEHHQPTLQHCWLIVTPEAQTPASQFITGFPGIRFHLEPISNLYSAQECYQVVRRVYQSCQLETNIPPAQVIADITGGTKPMTMGMVMACLESGFPIEHIPTHYDASGKPTGPLPPIEIKVNQP